MKNLTVSEAAAFLRAHDDFLILTHRRPDGDAVGCAAALCEGLRSLGKTAAVLENPQFTPKFRPYLEGLTRADVPQDACIVSVDIASEHIFAYNAAELATRVALCLDHHGRNTAYAAAGIVEPQTAACGELIYDILAALGPITPEMALPLYVALSTDTGCFKFSSTTANTHKVAAKLIEAGCHVEELNTLLFDTKPRARMEAERIARNHLEYYLDGRCALIYLTRDEIRQSGVDPADLEELTSLPISIEGVKVGLTLRQQKDGSFKISVRTGHDTNACNIARRLGGGGHPRAAGCEISGNPDNAKHAILEEVKKELDRADEEKEAQ